MADDALPGSAPRIGDALLNADAQGCIAVASPLLRRAHAIPPAAVSREQSVVLLDAFCAYV
jgi:hypothetical protein